MLYSLGVLVGVILVGSSGLKAVHSQRFVNHLARYELLPAQTLEAVAALIIALEGLLGLALFFQFHPHLILPLAMLLVLGFAVTQEWGARTGKIQDCGCYGDWLVLSPRQSLKLNLAYLLLLYLAWLNRPEESEGQLWQGFLICAGVGVLSYVSGASRRGPMLDLSPLRPGHPWRTEWLPQSQELKQGTWLVLFLSPTCPLCRQWFPWINRLSWEPQAPKLLGIMGEEAAEIQRIQTDQHILFPLMAMSKVSLDQLVYAFPTVIKLEEGRIQGKWIGQFPSEHWPTSQNAPPSEELKENLPGPESQDYFNG